MKKMTLALIAVVISCMFLTGCGDSNIALVKSGIMNAYPDVTLEKILEARFTDTKWSTFEKGGRKYVRFDGKITPKLHAIGCEKTGGMIGYTRDFKKQHAKFKNNYNINNKERAALRDKLERDLLNKHAWKVGSGFTIEWVIHPNSENFEMTGITVDGLIPEIRLDPDTVFTCIFAK